MATEVTGTSAVAWRPDVSTFAPADVVANALILTHSTVAGSIEGDAPSVRVAYVDDDAAAFTAEGADIDEANPALNEVVVHTAKISQLIRISREQYVQAGTSAQLAQSVARAVTKKANEAFVAQVAPTLPAVAPAAGLLNVAGIEDGGVIAGSLDGLIDLIAEIEGNGGTPSGLVVAPSTWASLRRLKTGTGSNQSLLGAGTDDAEKRLLGLPVTVTGAMPAGTGLVIDRNAVVSAVGQVQIATSTDRYFESDSIGLRATFRIGHAVVRADRLGKFTVADDES